MNFKKTAGITLFAAIAFGAVGWNWNTKREENKAILETTLQKVAKIATAAIDGDRYAMLTATNRISKADYDKALEPLTQLHLAHPEIAHVYTVSLLGGQPWVVLDTAGKVRNNPAHIWNYQIPEGQGAIHKVASPDGALDRSLRNKEVAWEKENPTRSDFGADIALYTPFFTTDGSQAGILALTMNRKVQEQANAAVNKEAMMHGGIVVVFLLISMFVGAGSASETEKERARRTRLEEQFRTMTERIPGVVFIFASRSKKSKGEFPFISGGIQTFRGIPAGSAEGSWSEMTDLVPDERRAEVQEKINRGIRETRQWEVEFESGGRWVQAAAQPQKQDDTTLWFGTMVDITNRKRDEEKLAQTNRILNQISEAPNAKATLDGICAFGEEPQEKACVIHWVDNGKIRAVAGMGIPEECAHALAQPRTIGKSEGAAATAGIGNDANHIASIADSGLYRNATDLRETLLASGFQSSTCYPIKSGENLIGAVEFLHKVGKPDPDNTAKDIQTTRLAEAAMERMHRMRVLEENERRYRTLFENSPVGICELDQDRRKVFSNNTYENNIQPDTRDKIEFSDEEQMEIKDGERTLLVESRNIQKPNGKIHRITFAYDISEQRNQVDEALISKNAAEAANKEKSRFLAVMSHEIRTPLHGILGFASLLEKEEKELKLKTYASRILRCGETLAATINDILDLSKIEAGKIDVEKRGFDPKETLESVCELLGTKAKEKGVGIKLVTKNLRPIHNDETRLHQIVANLVGNAVKFTERGDVTVTATILPGDKLQVSVKDTGIGISEEQQKRLFQPFSQADPSTTRRFGGTGLGLVISKKLCELLGGDISLASEPGKGTTFTFWIDAPEGKIEPKSRIITDPSQIIPLNILVAEDDETNRMLIDQILKSFGHEVEFATNGREAVRRAEELGDWADIMLMDMRMPELDGIEATQEIRRLGLKKFPIIALTANAMQEDRERCEAAGMDNYLTKPLNIPMLQNALQLCQKEKILKEQAKPASEPKKASKKGKKTEAETTDSAEGAKPETTPVSSWGSFLVEDEAEPAAEPSGEANAETDAAEPPSPFAPIEPEAPEEVEYLNQKTISSYFGFIPPSVAQTLVAKIKETTQKQTNNIVDESSPPALKAREAHSMFGAVGTLGCTELARIAKILEKHFDQSADPHELTDILPEVLRKTMAELDKYLAEHSN